MTVDDRGEGEVSQIMTVDDRGGSQPAGLQKNAPFWTKIDKNEPFLA